MTAYHSPTRPHLTNGLPCWASCPGTALPDPYLSPLESGKWEVRLMLTNARHTGHWEIIELSLDSVALFLECWRQDPEQTLIEWFHCQPPALEITQIKELDSILNTFLPAKPQTLTGSIRRFTRKAI